MDPSEAGPSSSGANGPRKDVPTRDGNELPLVPYEEPAAKRRRCISPLTIHRVQKANGTNSKDEYCVVPSQTIPRHRRNKASKPNYCEDSSLRRKQPRNLGLGAIPNEKLNNSPSDLELIAIYPACYPLCRLREDDMDTICGTMYNYLHGLLGVTMTMRFRFNRDCFLEKGLIVFAPKDKYTKVLLFKAFRRVTPHMGINLEIGEYENVRNAVTLVAELPTYSSQKEVTEILVELLFPNHGERIDICHWRAFFNENGRRRSLIVFIKAGDYEELKRRGMTLSFCLGELVFHKLSFRDQLSHRHLPVEQSGPLKYDCGKANAARETTVRLAAAASGATAASSATAGSTAVAIGPAAAASAATAASSATAGSTAVAIGPAAAASAATAASSATAVGSTAVATRPPRDARPAAAIGPVRVVLSAATAHAAAAEKRTPSPRKNRLINLL